MTDPKITVLMPVYNGETYLNEAIESVLRQTFTAFEFLIINDSSTDRSVKIIESYDESRIRLVHNETNLKLISTLNKGLELARGEYIARMDADDLMLPQRLEKQIQYLDANPQICVVGSWWENVDEHGKFLSCTRVPTEDYLCALMIFEKGEGPVGHPCVMYRTEIVRHLRYSPEYVDSEDTDLWFRVISLGHKIANIPEVLMLYRVHEEQICQKSRVQSQAHERALSDFLSEKFSESIKPDIAALTRPVNFNDTCFQNLSQLYQMLSLKKHIIQAFFDEYTLTSNQLVACVLITWESLLGLCHLRIVNATRMFMVDLKFCLRIIGHNLQERNPVVKAYYISRFAVLAIISSSLIILRNRIFNLASTAKRKLFKL
ncbi:glycosyltransferase family 2 protein [Thermodesulfobacteriota bacterium]